MPKTRTKKPGKRALEPVIQSLLTPRQWRLETVKPAWEQGAFKDQRLIDPALRALDGKASGLADFLAATVIPSFGSVVVPRLKAAFNPKGRRGDMWRLALICEQDPGGSIELCKSALKSGSREVKVSAVLGLSKHAECVPMFLELARAKSAALRGAALAALAEHDRPEITELFAKLIKGKELSLLECPFRETSNPQLLKLLHDESRRVFDALPTGGPELVDRFLDLLDCLKGHKDAGTVELLLACLEKSSQLIKLKGTHPWLNGGRIASGLAGLLYDISTPDAFDAILAQRKHLPPFYCYGTVIGSGLRRWSSGKVFEEFSRFLGCWRGEQRERNEHLQRYLLGSHGWPLGSLESLFGMPELGGLERVVWDPRWLEAAIEADDRAVVCCLAQPGDKKAIEYLLKKAGTTNMRDLGLIIRALARCRYSQVTDCFLNLVAKKVKRAMTVDSDLQSLFDNARYLPRRDLLKLNAFTAQLDGKFVNEYLAAIDPLHHSYQTHQP